IEYVIVRFDHNNQKVRLSLRSKQILDVMYEREEKEGANRRVLWRPEYGSFQIEATPGQPYGYNNELNGENSMNNVFNNVENNMRERRLDIKALLLEDEALLCLTHHPRLGCADTTVPFSKADPLNSASKSIFVSEAHICEAYERYLVMDRYYAERIGHKAVINTPIFKDTKTPDPFVETFNDTESNRAAKVDHIYMDETLFGAAASCLQVTMQATDVSEAFTLYDQLTPLTPIMLALGAATPIFRGYLTDNDCRLGVQLESNDDRTAEERGEKPLKHNAYRIPKSRVSPINTYLCKSNAAYNDSPIVYNKEYYNEMISAGVPSPLAQHIAYLFIRDPVVISRDKLDQDLETESEHFEGIQSTNWQTMRFKPPPLNQQSIGWRVEFRPMEIQMTDTQNAAFSVFVILLSRIVLQYKLNFIIPMTKIHQNITALKRDAVNRCKFWFRKDIFTQNTPQINCFKENRNRYESEDESYIEMSINEIMNVEFRPMEIQMTDTQNAAFSVFVILLSRIVLQYKLNFIIPMSKIHQNITTALKRDAINRCKFWFRKDIFTRNTPQINCFKENRNTYESEEESYIEMSINEIMNGYGNEFPGLIPLIREYVNSIALDVQTYNKVQQYIQLIADRASAKVKTTAQWIRDFVRKHADYKYDSVVNEKITYDLLNTLNRIQNESEC
ncbi:unnamed protein product, partial [Medioppia subpectinata]